MGNFDRQLTNMLDTMHREQLGPRIDNHCQWFYNTKSDIYHCPHTALFGKDLMARIPEWQAFNAGTFKHEEHTL